MQAGTDRCIRVSIPGGAECREASCSGALSWSAYLRQSREQRDTFSELLSTNEVPLKIATFERVRVETANLITLNQLIPKGAN